MKKNSIASIMTQQVVCVSPEQKIIDVKHIYEKKKFHHHIPVTKNDELIGMVSLIDFMYKIKGAGLDDNSEVYTETCVADIMTSNPYYLSSNESIETVAKELAKGKFSAIPIVDANKVVGIVTTVDLLKYFLNND